MADTPDHAGAGEPPQLPQPTPEDLALLQQQWRDWWWQTYGYQQEEPPRRRRHRGLAALLVLLLLMVVVVPAATSVVLLVHDLEGRQPSTRSHMADAGPLPSGDRRFTPSAQQRAYFFAVGPIAEKGTRVAKWTLPTVRVAIVGDSAAGDRKVVDAILATVNKTVDKPQFVYSRAHPQIVISFLDHREFQAVTSRTDDTIGWCDSNFTVADHSLQDARISVDDDPQYRDEREAVLYHEFGHALGLDDTRQNRYAGTIMYFRVSGPSDYTRLDLAAIRMLYDNRTTPGATHRELVRVWPRSTIGP